MVGKARPVGVDEGRILKAEVDLVRIGGAGPRLQTPELPLPARMPAMASIIVLAMLKALPIGTPSSTATDIASRCIS